jgi:hypothetical protein
MAAQDPLAEYFATSPRQSAGLSGRADTRGAVDQALNELRIPAEIDSDGDWRIETDVGPFLLVIDRDNGDVVLVQTLRVMDKEATEYADDMHALLLLNLEAEGARFAALTESEDANLLVLTSRVKAGALGRDTLETMLRDSMRLSRRLEELVGPEPESDTLERLE